MWKEVEKEDASFPGSWRNLGKRNLDFLISDDAFAVTSWIRKAYLWISCLKKEEIKFRRVLFLIAMAFQLPF